ncbi:MAG: KEOPS complex subunit Pcc1 [Candidatus Hodarchaeales archaeon]|jgi:tRNA threonylcarbamoyladenosine modification (KEOPS) complex  Pcc1 subunit
MDSRVSIETIIRLDSLEEANFIYESLIPEVNDHHFERSQIKLKLEGTSLIITVNSQDITAAKANISSMLRWITLVCELTQIIPKKIVNTQKNYPQY